MVWQASSDYGDVCKPAPAGYDWMLTEANVATGRQSDGRRQTCMEERHVHGVLQIPLLPGVSLAFWVNVWLKIGFRACFRQEVEERLLAGYQFLPRNPRMSKKKLKTN